MEANALKDCEHGPQIREGNQIHRTFNKYQPSISGTAHLPCGSKGSGCAMVRQGREHLRSWDVR